MKLTRLSASVIAAYVYFLLVSNFACVSGSLSWKVCVLLIMLSSIPSFSSLLCPPSSGARCPLASRLGRKSEGMLASCSSQSSKSESKMSGSSRSESLSRVALSRAELFRIFESLAAPLRFFVTTGLLLRPLSAKPRLMSCE